MKCRYYESEQAYHLQGIAGEVVFCPKLKVIPGYRPECYEMHRLYNNRQDAAENSIYSVYLDNVRAGWVFPVQALFSNQHDYAENEYFLRYAFIAYMKFFENIKEDDLFSYAEDDINECFSHFVDADQQMVLIDLENVRAIDGYQFKHYIPGFFAKGYVTKKGAYKFTRLQELDKNLKIKRISSVLADVAYLYEFFNEVLVSCPRGYPLFHALYQIVELLIYRIFGSEFNRLLSSYQDSDDPFQAKERIMELINERYRVTKLFSEYIQHGDSESERELNAACRRFLNKCQGKTVNDLSGNLYNTRCLLVHRLYTVKVDDFALLDEINEAFIELIYHVLVNFRERQ